jgi:hypothetical protein
VLQEIGYALKANKHIILFIEPGVEFGGLQSDLEFIPFDVSEPSTAMRKANDMLADLIAKNAGVSFQVSVQQEQPAR